MVTGTNSMRQKALSEMDRAELEEIAIALRLNFKEENEDKELLDIIKKSGKYKPKTEKRGNKTFVDKDGNLIHETLGKYVDVVVYPTLAAQQNTSIFASIGLYTIEFHPNVEVSIPLEIAKLLKNATQDEYYYDPKAISANGNVGAHLTRQVNKYIVKKASDEI